MKSSAILFVVAIAFLSFPIVANAGKWESASVTNAAGSREYKLWVPSGYDKGKRLPLLMMLHGCMQTPEGLAAISGMNELADRQTFLVVYPEQTAGANPLKCWNWFDPAHQMRESGEPSLLAAITTQVSASHKADSNRTYVAGISAGGAMAIVMGVTYPDLFAAIGVSAGLEFKAAVTVEGGLTAMKQGGPDPAAQGLLAFRAMGDKAHARRRMPVIIFQGDADPFVNPANAEQVIQQWATTNAYLSNKKPASDVTTQPVAMEGSVTGGHAFTRFVYKDRTGRNLMEKWIVKGMGHAWSGSPAAGPFADPKGPNASAELWRFFSDAHKAGSGASPAKTKPAGGR